LDLGSGYFPDSHDPQNARSPISQSRARGLDDLSTIRSRSVLTIKKIPLLIMLFKIRGFRGFKGNNPVPVLERGYFRLYIGVK
jgi:hypothetical protein